MEKDFLIKNKNKILSIFTFLLGLTLILAIFFPTLKALRLVFGGFFMLFLPGFCLSFVFYKKEDLAMVQRYFFSFILTMIFLPLTIYLLSLLKMFISLLNSILVVLGLIFLCLLILVLRNIKRLF